MRPFDPALLRVVPTTRRPIASLAVLGIAIGAATIGCAFALAGLVGAVVTGHSVPTWVAWLVAAFTLRGLLVWVNERVAARTGVTVTAAVRHGLLERWSRLPRESRPSDEAATTLAAQGCSSIEPYAARFLPTLVQAAVVPALAVAALLWVDWVSALIVVLTLPLLPLFAALIGRTTQQDTELRWAALTQLAGHFRDVMRGLPTLVAYGRADRQRETIGQVSAAHRRATMRTLRLAFMSSAALELLATISVAIVAVSVGLRMTHGGLDLTTGLLAILLSPEAYWPIRRVGAEFHAAADGAQALDQALPWLHNEPHEQDGHDEHVASDHGARTTSQRATSQRAGAVQVSEVTYAYPGGTRPVLRGLSVRAEHGLTVISGPSGAGKTTLLELIAGLRAPGSGQVEAPDRASIHLVSQRPFLVPGSIRTNLRLGNGAADDAIWTALRRVGLDGFVAGTVRGLDSLLGDEGVGVSAGQRARLALARAILADPAVLLLDEPTAHLDPDSAELVNALITELAADRIVIAVTHRSELMSRADLLVDLAGVLR